MDADEQAATDELPAGYLFGHYEILGSIGLGGMARVYRARHRESGVLVALKVMERSLLNSGASRRRFLQEGATAAAVRHSNVVGMLEVGSWQELPFIAMELLSGLDLDSYIQKRGPLPESDVVALALAIVAGMAAVHRAGVVHRDIKPSNIFLATGQSGLAAPKLLDFGISKLHGSMWETDTRTTGSREIIGTPAYLSPEALNGSRELGPRSDQYSLGVVLYECVVGRSPYAGLTLLQLLQALAAGVVQSPRKVRLDVSTELDSLICRMTATDPAERFDDIEAVGRALWLRAEEPARAIWASQFGQPEYTAPLLGTSSTGLGMTAHGMTLRSLTPVLVELPKPPTKRSSSRMTMAAAGLLVFIGMFGASRFFSAPEQVSTAAKVGVPPAQAASLVDSELLATALRSGSKSGSKRAPESANAKRKTSPSEEVMALEPAVKAARGSGPAVPGSGRNASSFSKKRSRKRRSRVMRSARKRPIRDELSNTAPADGESNRRETVSNDVSANLADDSDLSMLFAPPEGGRIKGRRERSATIGANGSPILD